MAFSGQFSPGNPLPITPDYGQYTMNLASPSVPQSSGLFPWRSVDKLLSLPGGRRKVIDATGGQYEGFNYLGLGLLFASLIVLPIEVAWLRQNQKRHVVLFVAFTALTDFAISHRVFVGHWQLFELPLPDHLALLFGIYRGSGRFFWLICYAQLAVVLVLGFRSSRPVIAACLVGAAIIQLFDVQPLKKQIIASIGHRAGAPALNPGQVARLTAAARYIDVVPSFQCSDVDRVLQANMELMLAAARANVPTNTVYLARDTYGVTWRACSASHPALRKCCGRDVTIIARKRSRRRGAAEVYEMSWCCSPNSRGQARSSPVSRAVDKKGKPHDKPSGAHPFDLTCAEHAITHRLTRPFRPQTNGMVERCNRRLGEHLDRRPQLQAHRRFRDHAERDAYLHTFVADYNRTRLRCLGYQAPTELLANLAGYNTSAGASATTRRCRYRSNAGCWRFPGRQSTGSRPRSAPRILRS
jgi:transposase InsO family protein